MKRYLFFGGVFIVLVVLPSLHILPFLEVYDEKRIFQVGLLLLVGLLFAAGLHATERDKLLGSTTSLQGIDIPYVAKLGVAGFIVLGFVSIWINGNWYYGFQELSLYVLLLVFLLSTANLCVQNLDHFNKGMVLLLLGFGGLYALKFFIGYGMSMFINYPLWPGWKYESRFFGWAHPRFFNQVQVWTLPLFMTGLINFKNKFKTITIVFGFLSVIWWCLLFASGARGAILSLLASALICFLIFRKHKKNWLKYFCFTLIGGLVSYFFLFKLFITTTSTTVSVARTTSSWRIYVWSETLDGIYEKLLLGYGPHKFASIQNEITEWAHPHNSVLQIGYEYGIPALFIVLGLILWGYYKWYIQTSTTELSDDESVIRIGISMSLLAGLGYSLLSGVIVMPLSQLWMVLIGGWALGVYWSQDAKCKMQGKRSLVQKWFFRSAIITAVVFLSYSMIYDVPKLKKNQQGYIEKYGAIYHPRFWQQGKIGWEEPHSSDDLHFSDE